jgi:hypothetical protein
MADRFGEILGGGGECAGAAEGDEGGVRRIAMELLFADCSVRLAETAKKFAGDDENWRRVLLLRIGRLIAAVDRAIWLIEKNCPEVAALESIFHSPAPRGPH